MTNSSLYDEEIEQAFLGILLTEPERLEEISWFNVAWFYSPVHARIYAVLNEEWKAGRPASAAFLAHYFKMDKDLDAVGGEQYIYDLADEVVSLSALNDYALHLQSLYARRSLLSLAGRIKAAATDPSPDMTPERIFTGIEKFLTDTKAVKKQDEPVDISTSASEAIRDAKNPMAGIKTGIPSLDFMTNGLKPGSLYILAGRPGMGKTAMGLTLATNVAMTGKAVLFFSLEMTHVELSKRILSRFSGEAVHSGQGGRGGWEAVERAVAQTSPLPLFIDDASGLTAADIAARTKRHKRRHGLDMIVVDYLGLIMPEDKRAMKVHQVEEIAQGMKRLSKDAGLPVVLLCQLSRALEGREDKRPQLSDLRDSGAIEQEADAVMFIYREEYYAAKGQKKSGGFRGSDKARQDDAEMAADLAALKGVAELIVAKHRQGAIGVVPLKFDAEGQVFYE